MIVCRGRFLWLDLLGVLEGVLEVKGELGP